MFRVKLKLTTSDMAEIFGVSRISYYKWRKGGKMRPAMQQRVETALRQIIRVVNEQRWPSGSEMRLSSTKRAKRLIELMALYD